MGWVLVIVVLLLIAALLVWRWAVANQSVATLDRLDALLRSSDVERVAGPVSLGEHVAQKLFVLRDTGAATDGLKPVLVFIHGGGWANGDPNDYDFMGRSLAPEGFVVVNSGYRLGEDGKFPAMLEDGAASLRWIVDNIADHGGDPERIYLMGHSAGAYNAVMLALDPQWLGREGLAEGTIDGVIGLAGPYDFLPLDGVGVERTFGDAPELEATQPVNFARGDTPPMLLATGDEDTVVYPRNSRSLAKALTEAGAPTEPLILEGVGHIPIMTALARPFDRDARIKTAVLKFLRQAEQQRIVRAEDASSVPVQAEIR